MVDGKQTTEEAFGLGFSKHNGNLGHLSKHVSSWFTAESLCEILCLGSSEPETLGVDWLAKGGKRYRPMLTVAVYAALSPAEADIDQGARNLAIAVECFHKASLIHDDIEDGDDIRYGQETPARKAGVPQAINVGDWLLGKGYQMLAEWNGPDADKTYMLKVASKCHCRLCIGQGRELAMCNEPRDWTVKSLLDIFGDKTSPAFNVALQAGAVAAKADAAILKQLETYSQALGIAYQIKDDICDGIDCADLEKARPSLILTLAVEHALPHERKELLNKLNSTDQAVKSVAIESVLTNKHIWSEARDLYDYYRGQAQRRLDKISNTNIGQALSELNAFIFNGYDNSLQGLH